jgi:hypothetical protein
VTVFREIKVKIVAKFREISLKLSRNWKVICYPKEKKLGFYENYDSLIINYDSHQNKSL